MGKVKIKHLVPIKLTKWNGKETVEITGAVDVFIDTESNIVIVRTKDIAYMYDWSNVLTIEAEGVVVDYD